ncbi:MAG: TRAP transporter small permease subunit [Limimaricola sp.]|uniref:TRAP transporter small permease subunit n=1 Tax=Limimaricola sp. TaxID=2211665 RepID=UPI001DD1B920|nr:TRAP transporter small permease subunit [Limimaricola sp.]MBI1416224.1 TRAP transporter small permease subunit [Limimaricola sp.]
MLSAIRTIDQFSTAIGKAFGWYILILTLGTCYEVFVRYVMNNPTDWNYDLSYNMYGASFIMAGAYTLSRNAHVRGDIIYRLLSERKQATIDLTLYVLFFFPGVSALTFAGWSYAAKSWRYHEVSIYSPVDIPIFPLKTLIPVAGALLLLQGAAEVMRCIYCLRTGGWPQRAQDVEEMETAILHEREFMATHDEIEMAKGHAGEKA